MVQLSEFVIQQHTTGPETHWDLMIQHGDFLQTWHLDIHPENIEDMTAAATKIHDHPLRFLTYEGPVCNDTGRVAIVDRGTFTVTCRAADCIELTFAGQILIGRFSLKQIEEKNWTLKYDP